MSDPDDKPDRLLSDPQLADMFAVSEGFVRNGGLGLPYIKIGRLKRTRESEAKRLIAERTVTKRRRKRPDGEIEEIDLTSGARTSVQQTQP